MKLSIALEALQRIEDEFGDIEIGVAVRDIEDGILISPLVGIGYTATENPIVILYPFFKGGEVKDSGLSSSRLDA
jgi:hypothetical protein